MKVRSGPSPRSGYGPKGLYSYPDLLIVCGELKFHDEHRDVLLNPTVIIEVLSPATEAFDRGEKWARYQTWLPELSDYLLVSQVKPQIDHFQRQAGGEWLYSLIRGLGESIQLNSVGCALQLAEIYDRIAFPSEAPESPGGG
jgi:Uma2 family endonuclease